MKNSFVRRGLVAASALVLAAGLAACGDDDAGANDDKDLGSVVIVGQKFTEADLLTQLYKELLEDAGFDATVKNLGTRDVYIDPLIKGDVQVSADYLASMTETLNRKANGDDAATVASPDVEATLGELNKLGEQYGLTALSPAQAQDSNAYAVTKEFAEENNLKTLSDLGASGLAVKLGANSDCPQRPDCQIGLEKTYGIKISGFNGTGFGSPQTKKDLKDGATQLGQVGSTDATLDADGLVILEDDKTLQNAENLVPIVNSEWLAANPEAKEALEKLAAVLTTEDLTALIGKVDLEREKTEDVAEAYLEEKGLID